VRATEEEYHGAESEEEKGDYYRDDDGNCGCGVGTVVRVARVGGGGRGRGHGVHEGVGGASFVWQDG
jgi:hypothetical protein